MKLRLPNKLQAALLAAFTAAAFTVPQAQASTAAELNTALGELRTLNNYAQGDDYTFSYTLTTVGTNGTNSILELASDYFFDTQSGSYGGLSTSRTSVSGWPNTTSHEANLNVWDVTSRLTGWITRDANGTGTGGSSLNGSTITVKYSADTNTTTFELYHKNKNTTDRVIMTGVALNAGDFTFGTMTSAGTDLVFRAGKDYVWNGTDGNATWNAANTNWLDGETAAALASTGNALFTANGAVKSVTIGESVVAKNMVVQDSYAFAMGGNTVNVTAGMELASGKTLTLDGAGTLNVGANIAGGGNITKTGGGNLNLNASANLGTLTVESANTLTVQGGTVSVATLAGEGVLNITSGAVVANSSATAFNGVKLSGSGTYALKSGSTTLTAGLGDNWTGTVRVTDLDANGSRDMSGLRTSLSTLELKGFNGWMSNWTGTLDYNIKLTNGSARYGWRNGAFGGEGSVMNNTGNWSGDGKFVAAVNSGRYMDYTYSGNISAWTGEFELLNGTTKLKFSSNATDVKAKITQTGGALKLYADTDVAFSNTVNVTSLDVTANKQATFGGTTNIANGVTLGAGSTLVNTGALTIGGTVIFGGNAIQNSGTVAFGSNLVFNLNGLQAETVENVHTYTLFTGSDVDMTSLGVTNISIEGGTAGKVWDFKTPGKISWSLSSSVAWNGGAEGVWDYATANWGDPKVTFTRGFDAEFNDSANVTVVDAIEADAIVVAADKELSLTAGGQGTLQAQGLTVNGTLTTNLTVGGLTAYNVAEGATWNIGAAQTLGAGTKAGTINVLAGARVDITDNAPTVVNGMTNSGTVALTLSSSGDTRLEMNAASDGTVELTGGTLDYRSELGTQTIKLTGTKLLFGTKKGSEAIDTIFDHNIVLGANTTIQVHGTSQHKSVTINGTITGNYDLTKTDGNQTTTFAGKVTVHKLITTAESTGKTVIAAGADISNNLAPTKGTMELHGAVTIGNDLDLSIGNTSEATVVIASDGNVTTKGMWMRSAAHIELQEGGQLTLSDAGLKLVGLESGGSVTTTAANTSYGVSRNDFTITGAAVTATKDLTLGNKLTNSSLAIGTRTVTLSNTGNTLTGLSIADGGTLTLSDDNVINGITSLEVGNGATLNLGSGKQGSLTTLTINDGGTVISSRQGQASGFLANNGTVVINGSGVLKFTGNNDALGWGSGHVASVTLNGTDAEHVAKLDLSGQSGSETMVSNLVLNGYSLITNSSNNRGFNTFGGSITVTGIENEIERMEIRANATINVVNAGDTLSVGVMALGSDSGKELTKTGAGTLTFTGSAATKKLTISEGTVVMGGDATLEGLVIAADGTLQVAGGTTTVSGGTNAINKTLEIGAVGTLSLTAGSYALDGLAVQGYTQEFVGDEGQTIPTGSGFLKTSGTVQVANILSGGALNVGTDVTFTHNGTAVEVATDTGIGTLTGDVNYNALYVNNGEPVSYAAAQAIAQAQPGSPTVNSVHLTVAGATINMDAAATIGLAIADNATGTVNATADTSISGITGAPAKLIVTGDSVVTLTSANAALTAAVEIDGTATLKMGNAGALGNTSGVTVRTGATLDVNGAKNQDTCISVTLAGGKLANTGNEASYGSKQLVNSLVVANNSIVDAQNNDFGIISGSYAESTLTLNATLEKIGSHDFHLANTTVTGEGAIKVTEGAVWFGRADAADIGSYASDFIMNGGNVKGRLALADNITVTTVANGGTFSANVTNNGHTITFDGTGNLTMSGVISGNGGLTKEGAGTLTLNGTQTYTGDTVVKGGTLDIQGSISDNSKVKVEESANIAGRTENITVGIEAGKTATFTNEGGYTPKDSHVTFSSKGLGVVVSNLGNEEAFYSLDNGKMRVTAQQMVVDIFADQDVQVDNVLAVQEITNLGPVSLKLTSVVGKTLDDVIAYGGDIEIDNLEAAQRLRELSIGSGRDVTFLQKLGESETAAKEATVTIAEFVWHDSETGAEDYYYGGTLHAGGGTLHANLVLSHFSFWDLDGGSMNLGSELTLRDSIWLDADTIKALDLMEIGETHWMVNAVDGTKITYDDADVWYDSKFVRDAYEDDGTSLKGDFIIVQNNDGTKWGLKKVSDTPEPTTGTLSLLALAALAARRRRH